MLHVSRGIYFLLLIVGLMSSLHLVDGISESRLARSTNEDREGSIFDIGPIRRPNPRPRPKGSSLHLVDGISESRLARSTNEDREGSIFDIGPIRRPNPRPRPKD